MNSLEDILNKFNAVKFENNTLLSRYIIKIDLNDTLEVIVFKSDGREVRFIHDNFPAQRRIFSTNIPYTSIEDFESDIKRMKLNIKKSRR